MQNDKNITSEFLALVYAPPAYKLTLNEIETNLNRITHVLKHTKVLRDTEVLQLKQFNPYKND